MGKAKKTRKFATVKRMLNPNDIRLKENQVKQQKKEAEVKEKASRRVTQVASSLFLQHNDALVPPYRVLIDTNFINFSLQNKLELISDFLTKYKPSMVQNDGSKPWIWVKKADSDKTNEGSEPATIEAEELLKEVTEKVEGIKNDDSIPVRANKKKGTKSKKEVREQLKEISIRHGFVSGKWLIFAPSEKVDLIWSSIATSLVDGPLSSTCAHLAKVSTCPQEETPNYQHVLCLYMPDVYDKDAVIEVMKVLLRQHGLNLMGVKSNLYTTIGLDSKHPSGIQSTVWKNSALMKDTEMKKLTLRKRRSRKKAVNDDPFASDDEDDKKATGHGEAPKKEAKTKKAPVAKRPRAVFESDDDQEDDEEKQRKEDLHAKKAAPKAKATGTQKRRKSDDEEEEEERPKKRGGRK
ncbi:hypothetical protein EW026_g1350 [Hermanssonia centrifuga]|uniref:Uncharacterized protein n=1 Tax=Hermanssonia centrifuga TaxID=98765 RepID=A0A4S4KRS3_9APHY|nr:hypothetical protein EW026_g1350 [Hermanssonia centrifuga]